jgi:hypothetical protein
VIKQVYRLPLFNGSLRITPLLSPHDQMPKIHIQYQDQVGAWKHYTTKHHQGDAYRTAVNHARSTGKRLRLVDEKGNLLDLIDP